MVSAHRGWGTQRAIPGARVFVPPRSGEPAPSGPPLGPLMRPVQPPVRAGDQAGTNPGAPAVQRRCSSVPRGSRAQLSWLRAPVLHRGVPLPVSKGNCRRSTTVGD